MNDRGLKILIVNIIDDYLRHGKLTEWEGVYPWICVLKKFYPATFNRYKRLKRYLLENDLEV